MRTPTLHRRHRVLAAGALISAVALGAVTATQAAATGGDTPPKPPRSGGPAIGYQPTDEAPDDLNEANDAFAACMREHGQKTFPSFHAAKDGDGGVSFTVMMRVRGGKAPALDSAAFRKAFKACKGPLEEAGVSFPKHGHPFPHGERLPTPPKRPGDGTWHKQPVTGAGHYARTA
ncbi:hypothetical protein [Streptomyces sp. WG-D5]